MTPTLSAEEIEAKMKSIIADSLCIDAQKIQMKSNLMKDLGAESIDFLDIMFRMEKEFNIKVPQREIERQARGGLTPEEFEVDAVLQEKGAARLRSLLPEIPAEDITAGLPLRELPAKFTVEVFVNMVKRKMDGNLWVDDAVQTTSPTDVSSSL